MGKINKMKQRVFLFGIDGAAPELIFESWLGELPTIKKLMHNGVYARMNSAIPPSTIVAWNSMISGKDTSEIGVFSYTFKDKEGKTQMVSSKNINSPLLWDILGEQGKKTIALYVPLSYPVKPINGIMVSDFLTPGINSECAFPAEIKEKIKKFGNTEIFFDVAVGLAEHKGLEIGTLLKNTYEMTEMQLKLLEEFISGEDNTNGSCKDWDFFMAVIIGTDRLQHMIWNHFDESHRNFIKDSPHKNALKDYYKFLDNRLGKILETIKKDDEKNNCNTTIIVASDHGMIRQEGKININNWLIEQGYLVLKEGIGLKERKRFSPDFVDMEKTAAYGGGAYNARVYINREKISDLGKYKELRDEIAEKLKKIPDSNGKKIDTKVYTAEEIYADTTNPECPDLTVYFDDLRWASNPDLGQEGLYSWKTAVGADTAGHSRQGCFIISGAGIKPKGKIDDIDIKQAAPTILKLLNAKIPADIKVKPVDITEEAF